MGGTGFGGGDAARSLWRELRPGLWKQRKQWIFSNVVIGPILTIGDGVKIQNNISVNEGVTLEDYAFSGPSMVFSHVFNPREPRSGGWKSFGPPWFGGERAWEPTARWSAA